VTFQIIAAVLGGVVLWVLFVVVRVPTRTTPGLAKGVEKAPVKPEPEPAKDEKAD